MYIQHNIIYVYHPWSPVIVLQRILCVNRNKDYYISSCQLFQDIVVTRRRTQYISMTRCVCVLIQPYGVSIVVYLLFALYMQNIRIYFVFDERHHRRTLRIIKPSCFQYMCSIICVGQIYANYTVV